MWFKVLRGVPSGARALPPSPPFGGFGVGVQLAGPLALAGSALPGWGVSGDEVGPVQEPDHGYPAD